MKRGPRKTTRLDLEIEFSTRVRRLTRPQQQALFVRILRRSLPDTPDDGRTWWVVDPAGGKTLL
jgi:hypothetical protein